MGKRYIIAIIIAISILVVNQIFIQYFLHEKKYDAKTINLAGKQRMLSQKINLEFYKLEEDQLKSEILPQLFSEWKTTHYALMNESEEAKLSPIVQPQALELMTRLSSRISFVDNQLKRLQAKQSIDIAAINSNQTEFLKNMNKVVSLLETTSSEKLQFIIYMEILLMIFSMLVILLEIIFVFKPNHQKLVSYLKATQHSKEKLEKSLVELERKNKDLEQFAYVASHDLQEPLRTIISFSQLLYRKNKDRFDEDGKEEMNLIINASRRMKSLITGLLEYTRIGRAKAIKTIDCNDLVNTVKEDLSLILAEKKAKIDIGELPQINAYETEVRQLFQNLITNALKFQKTKVQPEIFITSEALQGRYKFSVQDNGIGIAEEYQEQIFSIFKRLHTIDQYEGTGIGLAQCKKIVELHNGQIWVESEENEGSIFHFTIPYSLS